MNRRRFVVMSFVSLAVVTAAVAGLAVYSSYGVKAAGAGLPSAVGYIPVRTRAVFGMNVKKFVASPAFTKLEARHGKSIGDDLAEFIARTGVDPRRDLHYLIVASPAEFEHKGEGLAIAVGRFNTGAITTFVNGRTTPRTIEHRGTTVLTFAEGSRLERGVALIGETEIAVGDLESLKAMLDVRAKAAPSVTTGATMGPLIRQLDADRMFWFAGDAAGILAKAPHGTKLGDSLGSLREVSGTLDVTEAVTGRIMLAVADEESARKFADVARGAVALGQLAGDHDERLAELLKGVSVRQDRKKIRITVNFPLDLIDRLEHLPRIGHHRAGI